jgi:hypothetical protein
MNAGRRKRILSKSAFFVWATLLFVTSSSLTAAHFYTLPKPDSADSALERGLASLRSPAERHDWLTVHVLYAQCRCSRKILEHLATSKRPSRTREKLLLVGSRDELTTTLDAIAKRGFGIVRTTPKELRDRFHVQAAPLLLVVSPEGKIRYAGGYTEHKQGPNPRDAEIVSALIANGHPNALPLFGCAVSDELRKLLDPLSLKELDDRK